MTALAPAPGDRLAIGSDSAGSQKDGWIALLASNGAEMWAHLIDLGGSEYVVGVGADSAGNVVGLIYSFDSTASTETYHLVSYDEDGQLTHQEALAADGFVPTAMAVAPGGDILLAGVVHSPEALFDVVVRRLDPKGALRWETTWAGPGASWERPESIRLMANGGLLLAGSTGDFAAEGQDFWVAVLNP